MRKRIRSFWSVGAFVAKRRAYVRQENCSKQLPPHPDERKHSDVQEIAELSHGNERLEGRCGSTSATRVNRRSGSKAGLFAKFKNTGLFNRLPRDQECCRAAPG
jgi:hypothetical protein